MAWKAGATLLLGASLVGAVVRIRDGDYVYRGASLLGVSIAIWLWSMGSRSAAQSAKDNAFD